jgi:hypothetical protein
MRVATIQRKPTFRNEIPLGVNTYKGYSKNKIITIPDNPARKIVGGLAGTGKSVLQKRIASYVFKQRSALILDCQGEDWRLIKYPNSKPYPLFKYQGETAFGFENLINYAPLFAKGEHHPDDNMFGFSMEQFNSKDFRGLGVAEKSSRVIAHIIQKNKGMSPNDFVDAFSHYPTSDAYFKTYAQRTGIKKLNIDSSLNFQIKDSIETSIADWGESNLFVQQNDSHFKKSFIDDLIKRKIVNVNFHQFEEYMSFYGGKIIRDIYKWARMNHRRKLGFKPPAIVIEEAGLMLPRDDRWHKLGSTKWTIELLRRARKYNMDVTLISQQLSDMVKDIKNHVNTYLLSQLVADDLEFLSKILSPAIIFALKNLDASKREWLVAYDRQNFDTFIPYNSPVEIHRVER